MTFRTIFFDFGGTLARTKPPLSEPATLWVATCREFGVDLTETEVQGALRSVERKLKGRIYDFLGRTGEFWRMNDVAVMEELGIREQQAPIAEVIEQRFGDPSAVELYPESVAVLAALKSEGYRSGVISNHHDGLLKLLKYQGLDRYLETVTFSQEVGAEKPDPAIFAKALERAGSPSSEAIHVGDSLESDVFGARRSGLQPVWVNREGRPNTSGTFAIRTLSELPLILEGLNLRPTR
ncbi:MAG: HAD family hydrolase [Candidatus Lutacidiplasmatales archaeon]